MHKRTDGSSLFTVYGEGNGTDSHGRGPKRTSPRPPLGLHDPMLAFGSWGTDNPCMTQKELVLESIKALPDQASLEEIAQRVEFLAALQKGLEQIDRGESIPHDEVKKQLAQWLTS